MPKEVSYDPLYDSLYNRIWDPEEGDTKGFETVEALFEIVFNRELDHLERKVMHLRFWCKEEWSDIASAMSMTQRNMHYVRDRAYAKIKSSPIIQSIAGALMQNIDLTSMPSDSCAATSSSPTL
ncbi:MAG TPA: hypothetical protein P5110_07525 [Candidatus Omnitrophota bacterium]|nr:hypothetical protein [Candidatus Omnitrophota bacterium]